MGISENKKIHKNSCDGYTISTSGRVLKIPHLTPDKGIPYERIA